MGRADVLVLSFRPPESMLADKKTVRRAAGHASGMRRANILGAANGSSTTDIAVCDPGGRECDIRKGASTDHPAPVSPARGLRGIDTSLQSHAENPPRMPALRSNYRSTPAGS